MINLAHAAQQLLFAAEANFELQARVLRCGGGSLHHCANWRNADGEICMGNGFWCTKKSAE